MNKKGFTLIELLAVIIILGILMIIAIPSVTKYISDSRKNSYVDTAKEIISGARNIVNEGKLGMYDTNTTYYIPSSYIKTENASKSPYGDFVEAYVVVIYDGTGYKYYWTSVDDAGQGVKGIISFDKLDVDNIESDLNPDMVDPTKTKIGIGNRTEIKVLDNNGSWIHEIHLDNTSNNVSEVGGEVNGSGSGSSSGTTPSNIVCKRATTLHTATCNKSGINNGCSKTVGDGNTITYGTIVSGTPKAGDAYDCDVNDDGTYDSQTERFYYVTSDGNNSILIYYININNTATYAYDLSDQNYHGPRTGFEQLPSTIEWSNPGLIAPGTRQIVADDGSTSTTGGTIESFTYTDKAARFLTIHEVNNACGITSGRYSAGELNGCMWLLENVGQYERISGTYGYWLETPRSIDSDRVWFVLGDSRDVNNSNASHSGGYGVRPVITVKTSDLE